MSPGSPLVSVLLPVFDPNSSWVEECVRSVVNQTYSDLELVVVDDGSPVFNDRLFSWAEDRLTNVSVIRQENKGFTRATNEAYRTSKGSFVAPIGQDDKWDPSKIERQIKATNCGFDVVFTDVVKIDENGQHTGEVSFPNDSSFKSIVRHCFPIYESSLISKAVLPEDTLLDSSFQVAGDWDLWLRIWRRSSITHVDAPLTYKRFHPDKETSRNYNQAVRESEKMIRRIARREPFDEDAIMQRFYRSKSETLRRYGFWATASIMNLKYIYRTVKVDTKKLVHKLRNPPNLYDLLQKALSDQKSVIDLGCGKDSPMKYVEGPEYRVGVEVHEPDLQKSKEKEIHDEYICGDVLDVLSDEDENSYDSAIAIDVLEHLTKDEGFQMIAHMERVARSRVVLFTPNGFIHQDSYDGNPHQVHKSGWTVEELRNLGFEVTGVNGLKLLRGSRARHRRPKFLTRKISELTQHFVKHTPALAYALYAYKKM